MKQKVHRASQLGFGADHLPHSLPLTNLSKIDSYDELYAPNSSNGYGINGASQTMKWIIEGSDAFTDLKKSYVRLQGRWVRVAGLPANQYKPATADDCTVSEGFPGTLFQRTNLRLNGQNMAPLRGGDEWLHWTKNTLLSDSSSGQNSVHTHAIATDSDNGLSLNQLSTPGYAWDLSASNTGAAMRRNAILNIDGAGTTTTATTDDKFEYYYQPPLGAWQAFSDKLMPDNISFQLELQLNDYSKYIQASAGEEWQFVLSQADLILHRVVLADEVKRSLNEAMVVAPYLAHGHFREYNPKVTSSKTFAFNNIYSGTRPDYVLVGVQASLSTSSSLYNIQYMSNGNSGNIAPVENFLEDFNIIVSGKTVPQRSLQTISQFAMTRQYNYLLDVCNKTSTQPLVSYKQYCQNYPWIVIDLKNDSADGMFDMTGSCNIDVRGVFSTTPVQEQIVHFIAVYPSVIEVDARRSVKLTSLDDEPIEF